MADVSEKPTATDAIKNDESQVDPTSPTIEISQHSDKVIKHRVRVQKKNGRYYFQHPYARLFVSYFVIFCNFLIYAEDPVSHSRANCTIPVVGNDFAFVTYRYRTEIVSCPAFVFVTKILFISGHCILHLCVGTKNLFSLYIASVS